MGLLDKAIAAADQASTRVKEGVDDVQDRRLLSHAYEQLGQTTYELIQSGELTHAGLTTKTDEIRALHERLGGEGTAAASS
ncbi:MAG TPA: hypothetical protein VKG38_14285 [Solirubrobacteraceae bacterium]|nr:hypothetical protein [Solirubrobacteraceae bacterium]